MAASIFDMIYDGTSPSVTISNHKHNGSQT